MDSITNEHGHTQTNKAYPVSLTILALVTIKLAAYIISRMSPILVTASGLIMARVLWGDIIGREEMRSYTTEEK